MGGHHKQCIQPRRCDPFFAHTLTMPNFNIRLLETPEDMTLVEELQRAVWPGSETEVVPLHMLITVVHNGGLVLGAFKAEKIICFVFGFPGIEKKPDGPRLKH